VSEDKSKFSPPPPPIFVLSRQTPLIQKRARARPVFSKRKTGRRRSRCRGEGLEGQFSLEPISARSPFFPHKRINTRICCLAFPRCPVLSSPAFFPPLPGSSHSLAPRCRPPTVIQELKKKALKQEEKREKGKRREWRRTKVALECKCGGGWGDEI